MPLDNEIHKAVIVCTHVMENNTLVIVASKFALS